MEKLGLDLDDGSSPADAKQSNPQVNIFINLIIYNYNYNFVISIIDIYFNFILGST